MRNARRRALGRDFWTLLSSSGLSNLADGVFKLALPLIAIAFTRSPALVAGLELVRTLPWLVGALQVGALTDRFDRKKTMIWANTTRASLVLVPAVLIYFDAASIWTLYVAAAGTGIAEVFYDTASQSILPTILPRQSLDRANGRLFAVELGAQEFAGPPIAGVLVGIGLAISLFTSAGLWIVAIAALSFVRGRFRPERTGPSTSLRKDIREGLSFVYRQPVLRALALMVGMMNLASSAVFAVIVLFAVGPESTLRLTEAQFGILFATIAAGGVFGGLLAESIQTKVRRSRILTMSVLTTIVYLSAPAWIANAWMLGLLYLIGGLSTMLWNVITVSFRQRITPDHLLGRMNSAYRLLAWGTRPLGAAIGGLIGEVIGVRSVFGAVGIFALIVLIPNRAITEEALTAAETRSNDTQ